MLPLIGAFALASAPITSARDPAAVSGGTQVPPCTFPSAAQVSFGLGQCSGVLIHPQVVLLERTCISYGGFPEALAVRFGDGASLPITVAVDTNNCVFDESFGACVFEDVIDLPIAPILAGCERNALVAGATGFIVGFGAAMPGAYDEVKHGAEVEITEVNDQAVWIDGEAAPCDGDPGAPLFLRVSDGSWRLAGIAAAAGCENPSVYFNVAERVGFIESELGIDVTPCHDADGLPEPSASCGSFYAGGDADEGTYPQLCDGAPLGPPQGACEGDDMPPEVTIVAPADDVVLAEPPALVRIEVDASDRAGLGVRDVRLEIDGALQALELNEPPYVFDVELPAGTWEIAAQARDWGGNTDESAPVVIQVGPVSDPGVETSSSGGGDGGGDSTSATSDGQTSDPSGAEGSGGPDDPGEPAQDEVPRGCACSTAMGGSAMPTWVIAAIALWSGRRRRFTW